MGENVYLWSTTALTNGNVDASINFQEGQLPSTVNNSSRSVMAAVARFIKDTNGSLATAGSANVYTLAVNGTYAALATGLRARFRASFTNTGAATLNVTPSGGSALGAKSIRKFGTANEAPLAAGDILLGMHYEVEYDASLNSAAGGWLLLNPGVVGRIIPYTQFVFEGDSMTVHNDATSWATVLVATDAAFTNTTVYNYAVNGDRAILMASEYATEAHAVRPATQDAYFFLSAGSNDIAFPSTAADTYAALQAIWAVARADGYKVVAHTVPKRTGYSGATLTAWAALNALILNDPTLYDYLVRIDAVLPDPTDLTLFQVDGIHPTAAGYAVWAAEVYKTITANRVGATIKSPQALLDVVNGSPNITGSSVYEASIVGPNRDVPGTGKVNLLVSSNTAQAADCGGTIGLGGRYSTGSSNAPVFAWIKGAKENSTTDNLAGYVEFSVSSAIGAVVRALRFSSAGALRLIQYTAGLLRTDASGNVTALAGTSGAGVYFDGSGIPQTTSLLAASKLVVGGGAASAFATIASLGTSTTVLHGNASGNPSFSPVSLTADITGTLAVGNGGTGITAGNSGGIPYFSASNTVASSSTLLASQIVVGGGAGAQPGTIGSLGTASTVLHGNAAGNPTFGAIVTADISANQVTNAKLAQMATLTIKGNNTGGASDPIDLTAAQAAAVLGAVGGVLKSKLAAFTYNLATATGTQAITGVGFVPTAVIIIADNASAGSYACWSLSDSALSSAAIAVLGTAQYAGYAAAVKLFSDNTATNYATATIQSYDADGFTLSWVKTGSPTGTAELKALCFR